MKKCAQLRYFKSSFLFQKSSYSSSIISANAATVNDMMIQAQQLEENFRIKEAAKTYEKIIYELDPTLEEAYGKLMNIWITYGSAYGLKQDKLDKYLKQHQTYILNTKERPISNLNSRQ